MKVIKLNEETLNEVKLHSALDTIADYIRNYLSRNGVTTADHPVKVFPCYDLGLVKIVFEGTGVSYTAVPGKLDDKQITKNRPIKVIPNYPNATYNNGVFIDPNGTIIGDAYVSVPRNGNESDYSVELDDLLIKSSDTMKDFRSFVSHIGKDSIKGNRII